MHSACSEKNYDTEDVEKQELQKFKRKTKHRTITNEQEGMKKYSQNYEQFECKLCWRQRTKNT